MTHARAVLGVLYVDLHEIERLTRASLDRFSVPGFRASALSALEKRAADLRAALRAAEVTIHLARKADPNGVAALARSLKVAPYPETIARALSDLTGAIERHCTVERATQQPGATAP